ncbi:MAG: hypothetical protein NZ703_01580 [Gemmataceae bacterium]|nr:hypothetical protein [Gemmataceae bacterium]
MKRTATSPSEPQPPPPPSTIPETPGSGGQAEGPAWAAPGQPVRALSWPGWFTTMDGVLAALAIALVFLLASFTARNSDLWLHLAAGQRLLRGEYFPGGPDPFSYAAADRVWVHHSLLFDLLAYLAYQAHAYGLVLFKAVVVTLAFGMLLLARRRGQALWPWTVVLAVASLAAAPQFLVRSSVASLFFLSLTLLWLWYGHTVSPHSWRWPLVLAGLFWLWALSDQWFFLGPLVVALAWIGEAAQRYLVGRPVAAAPKVADNAANAATPVPPPAGGPFSARLSLGSGASSSGPEASGSPPQEVGGFPSLRALSWGLILGLLACTLTPFHVRIWELPVELTGLAVQDPRLDQLFLSPLSRAFYSSSSFGRNLNGLAYALLLGVGGVLFAFGAGQLRLAHLTIWLGLAGLSLWSIYAIPFFALAAVPLLAVQLNQLSAAVRLRSWQDVGSRLILLSSAAGRWLSFVLMLVGLVCAWPGWLHPTPGHPSGRRQVDWSVEPDPALVRAAEQLHRWRTEGYLPPEARGFLVSLELANYCAWFAPSEKVFVNSRYTHHKRELAVLAGVRGALGMHLRGELPGNDELQRQLAPWNVDYLGVHFTVVESRRQPELTALVQQLLWQDEEHFSLWYLDGRTTIGGWRARPGAEQPSFHRLRLDVVAEAFGPAVPRLTPPLVSAVVPLSGPEADFILRPRWPSPAIDEAFAWAQYSRLLEERHQRQLLAIQLTLRAIDQILGGSGLLLAMTPTMPAGAEQLAVPFLALRAARRAQADDPNDPDVYAALAEALALPRLPLSADERAVARATALRQCLSRLPPPDQFTFGTLHAHPTRIAAQLATVYLGERQPNGVFTGMPINLPAFHLLRRLGATGAAVVRGGQVVERTRTITLLPLDIARDMLRLAKEYLDADPRAFGEQTPKVAEELRNFLKQVDDDVQRLENLYEREKLRLPSGTQGLVAQLGFALRHNLIGEALRLLEDEQLMGAEELKASAAELSFARLVLLTALGRLEEAISVQQGLADRYDAIETLREPARWLRYQLAVLAGDYAEAGAILEDFAAATIGQDPSPPRRGTTLEQFPGIPFVTRSDGQPFPYRLIEAQATVAWLHPHLLDQLVYSQLLAAVQDPYDHYRQQLVVRRVSDAEYFWRRGYLYLVEGDILRARRCLEQSRRPGVPLWDVPEYSQPLAEEYLRLLQGRRLGTDR